MDNIGAEVGQKMRSAIKAKLMELGCYVDDELPDYIMVMVANKRTKSQMNEDLQLFLAAKTATFVDWLQVVLKKLKEITVTNPDIYKRDSKRKGDDASKADLIKIKKEKKDKKKDKKKDVIEDISPIKSLTDEIPVEASKLSEMRKIVILQESHNSDISSEVVNEDSFDIPPLSEVAVSNENELAEIEEKIRSVKSRLGLRVTSDFEEDDFINLKAEPEELFPNEKQQLVANKSGRKIQLIRSVPVARVEEVSNVTNDSSQQKSEHPRIVFGNDGSQKKESALNRLGKRNLFEPELLPSRHKKQKISLTRVREEEEKILGIKSGGDEKKKKDREDRRGKESVLKRLGVMSKVAIPQKEPPAESEIEVITKDVPSVIKVKPRTMPPTNKQANKNLLLKAVAEAQRSIAQTRLVGANAKPGALYTKKYRENQSHSEQPRKKLSQREKSKINSILVQSEKKSKKELDFSSDDDLVYVPKPVKRNKRSNEPLEYIPSSKEQDEEDKLLEMNTNQTFIITLDGVNKKQEKLPIVEAASSEESKKRKSPIVFDKSTPVVLPKKAIPEKLPIVKGQTAIKTKERCKYWPLCRQGDKCEFVHPVTPCKSFPQCKFGDKCLYVHPMCKFESSCTRKDCSYSHSNRSFNQVSAPALQKCKFFPNCTNPHCMFYHPRACKYGKYCKNQAECTFMHEVTAKNSFTWRSTIQP